MTTQQAKNIPLSILLEKMGFSTTKIKHSGNDVWFKSPFRPQEQDASFHINIRKNVWYDFGDGSGGDLVSFVQRFKNCDVSAALAFLDTLFPKNDQKSIPKSTLEKPISERFAKAESLILKSARPITNPLLITYLTEERRIDINTAKKFLVEVLYTQAQTDKNYYALGMVNRSGGYEVRNKYFKGSVVQKDITILIPEPDKVGRGLDSGSKTENKVSIFEGIFDFLSAYKYYGETLTEGEVIVMHSLALKETLIEYLNKRSFSTIYTYFDNDRAGEEMTVLIGQKFPSVHEPCSALFLPYKDFNAFWRAKRR
jgi:DNA primase